MTRDQLIYTIQFLRPKAEWSLRTDDYSGLEWLDKTQSKPSEQEILNNLVDKSPLALEWESLKDSSTTDKITFLAKHLGLE